MSVYDVKDGMWVCVEYEEEEGNMEKFLGKVMGGPVKDGKYEGSVRVRCLKEPLGITDPQDFEKEAMAVYYKKVYHAVCEPFQVQVGRKWLWQYHL